MIIAAEIQGRYKIKLPYKLEDLTITYDDDDDDKLIITVLHFSGT